MKKVIWFLPFILILTSCGSQSVEQSATSTLEIKNACNYLLTALTDDQKILNEQDQSRAESNARIAKDDPAFAEALMDYPSLSYGILYGNNWNEHALRMISMYGKASKLVTEDTSFSNTLKDSGMVWAKRLVLHQTPPSPLKGKLDEEQIQLDTREGNINRPVIKKTCNISGKLLP